MRPWLIGAIWGVAWAACGCGTMYNNEITSKGQPDSFRFYGGVRKDLEGYQDLPALQAKARGSEEKLLLAGAKASFPLELAMSAVGDTLLLPVTVAGMMAKTRQEPDRSPGNSQGERE